MSSSSLRRLFSYCCWSFGKILPSRQYRILILGVYSLIMLFGDQRRLSNVASLSVKFPEASTSKPTVTNIAKHIHNDRLTTNKTMPSSTPTLMPMKTPSSTPTTTTPLTDDDPKYILFYTSYWWTKDFQFGLGRQPFLDYRCPVNNCILHSKLDDIIVDGDESLNNNNKSNLLQPFHNNYSQYDAVLFSVIREDYFKIMNENESISSWRKPHQRFVFLTDESQIWPIHYLPGMNGFFNWTSTFRWKSDIPRPYGWFQPKSATTIGSTIKATPPPNVWVPGYDERKFYKSLPFRDESFRSLARRPGKVAWIVSHCNTYSKREQYVEALRKYISVDIFGKCNDRSFRFAFNSSCDQFTMNQEDDCSVFVQKHYKFYLGFENVFCNDYVTEKFFRRIDHSVVITLGQANYSEIAPPHSYIDVFDFDSPKSLANYLHELDQDDAKYLSYFWWKDYYEVVWRYEKEEEEVEGALDAETNYSSPPTKNSTRVTTRSIFGQSFCGLCERLHDPNAPNKVYGDIEQWWAGEAECTQRLPDLQMLIAKNDSSIS